MKRACIFDLDGTLLATEASIARVVNGALSSMGLAEQPVEMFRYYAGDGIAVTLKRALADAGDPELTHFEEGLPICRRLYAEDPLYEVRPYPHIEELIREMTERGLLIAVFSNKPHLQAIEVVEHFFGRGTFCQILGQSDALPKKPDPAGVHQLLCAMDLKQADCLYLGDTDTDMQTGRAAGLVTVGAAWGFRTRKELEENGADHIIDDPLELLSLL